MKTSARSLLALAALATTALAAPTPANGASFPITDLIDSDLTIAEYAAQLENQSVEERDLIKRQFSGDTYNQLTDGTACRPITVIYARGTTQGKLNLQSGYKTYTDFNCLAGNVGEANSEGPTFFNALASRVGGTSRLAIQGVTYPANVLGFLAGGDAAGATTMFNLINQVSATITIITSLRC
jgi:cutinase